MESLYYVLDKLPDLTLSRYSSLDESGVNGVLSRHSSFWRQMGRRGMLEREDAFHLFYEYDPAKPQGERLCVGIRFDLGGTGAEEYLEETLRSSPLSPFFALYPAAASRAPEKPEKGCYPAPDIDHAYRGSVHLIRKERQTRALDPRNEGYYTVSTWKMNRESRLYNMAKLMDAIGRPCLYVMSVYPTDETEELEDILSYLLPNLRQLTKAKVTVGASGAGLGQKDDNADNAVHYYIDLLEALSASPHFICDIQVLADDYRHAAYILDAAASEALAEGEYTLKPVRGCSFRQIREDTRPVLSMQSAPERLAFLPQLFLLDEMAAFGVFPALYPGETIETPKETLPDLDVEGLLLGEDPDHHRVEFPLANLSKHAFLAGVPGSGKTNSMMHLIHEMHVLHHIPVLILEPAKHEYRVLTSLPGMEDLELFSPGAFTRFPLHINPFEFPEGLSLAEHIRNLLAVFDGAFHLEPPMPFLLDRSVEDAYREHNWTHNMINCGALSYPTMSELYEKLEQRLERSEYAPEVRSNLKSALQVRIGSLMTREMGDIFDVPRSTLPPQEWIRHSAVVELEALGTDPANFMTLLLATLIRETLKVENYDKKALSGKPRHVMFLEEAHNLIGPVAQPSAGEAADPKTAATAYIVKMLAEVRALGEGIVIADQLPTAMAPEVLKNTSLKIGLRITAQDDRQLLGGTMSANPDQLEKMAVFTPGHALCSYEPLLKPFEVQIPFFEAKEGVLEDAEILQHLGGSAAYRNDLRASLEISAEGWEARWTRITGFRDTFIQAVTVYDQSSPEARKRQQTDIHRRFSHIMTELRDLVNAVYAFYSPFALVCETRNALGAKKENEDFRIEFCKLVCKQMLQYRRRADALTQELAKRGYTLNEAPQNRDKQRRLLLSTVLPQEKEAWNKIANPDYQTGGVSI